MARIIDFFDQERVPPVNHHPPEGEMHAAEHREKQIEGQDIEGEKDDSPRIQAPWSDDMGQGKERLGQRGINGTKACSN